MIRTLFLLILLSAVCVLAYDVVHGGFSKNRGVLYVELSSGLPGPGFDWWPMRSLDHALGYAALRKVGDREVLFTGTAEGNYFVPAGVVLIGGDKAVVSGTVHASDDVTLRNFAITGRGPGIRIESTGGVTASNVRVEGNEHDGVDMMFGARLTATKSVFSENRKGIYGRDRARVIITDSIINDNAQEGLDIRGFATSEIAGNTIVANGESGMELILGSSNAYVHDNVIRANKKSGITLEYARHAPELGTIALVSNTVENNEDTGVRCVSRAGGTRPHRYFARSVRLEDNTVFANENKEFSKTCKFDEPLDETSSEG